jgi:hypothetical protein
MKLLTILVALASQQAIAFTTSGSMRRALTAPGLRSGKVVEFDLEAPRFVTANFKCTPYA